MAVEVNDGSARWEIWLDDLKGNRLVLLDDVLEFSVAKIANNIGAFALSLPESYDSDLSLDGMVEFWRAPAGKALRLFNIGFMRRFEYAQAGNNTEITIISGPDGIDLLDRRIIAYAAGSSQSSKTDQADDMAKAIVDENLGASATDSNRDLETALSFTIQADAAAGPSITRGYSWKRVLQVIKSIVEDSAHQGTDLYFDVVPKFVSDKQISFEFRTSTGQPGRDKTGADEVIFGTKWGNLEKPSYIEDYTGEVNYVYAGGQGEGADREIVEVEDTIRSGASIWNRREAFADARSESSTAGVTSKANERLNQGKPVIRFSGELLNTPQAIYGIDWEWGDKVVVEYRGRQFEGPVLSTVFNVNRRRREKLSARMDLSV